MSKGRDISLRPKCVLILEQWEGPEGAGVWGEQWQVSVGGGEVRRCRPLLGTLDLVAVGMRGKTEAKKTHGRKQ